MKLVFQVTFFVTRIYFLSIFFNFQQKLMLAVAPSDEVDKNRDLKTIFGLFWYLLHQNKYYVCVMARQHSFRISNDNKKF